MTDSATPQDTAAPATAPPAVPPGQPAPAAPDPWAGPAGPEALAPLAPPETPEERAARLRRRRNALLRWGAAVLVLATAGTAAAIAVTAPERTRIPGLATANDGRYTFAPLALPPLPSGKAAPSASDSRNRHAADLRYLLLPAPREAGGSLTPVVFPTPTAVASQTAAASASASPSSAAPASGPASATPSAGAAPSTGPAQATADWVPCGDAAADQRDPAALAGKLAEDACRSATVREWTASDGTRTRIRLLGFGSSGEAWDVFSQLRSDGALKDLDLKAQSPEGFDQVPGVDSALRVGTARAASGEPSARAAYLSAGDVLAVIVMTNPKGVPAPAFRQVVTLQSDLLA
ncbi:hypothetical protein ACFVVX_03950 [Kitasatospora sp. NPDC058170]|uniref:hypothetical protein n=1 Tax=Kitasatospora sp. NPDC058170 TaxID=3346364 RepID=UPI0036DB77EC